MMWKASDPSYEHLNSRLGHIELLELLLSVSVDVDSPSDSGTSLVWAAGHSQQDAIKLLLEHKADKFNEATNAFYEGVKLELENIELVNAFKEAVEAERQFHD
nr:ankyrin repeat family protein [Tanacetum cinerariifolium]